ncbi:MAG: ABC transporter permease, partial [Acidobacteria bacterium]
MESTGKERKKKIRRESLARAFRELVWPRRGILGCGLLLILINRLAGLVLPGSTKYLIDDVVQKRNLQLLKPLVVVVGAAVLVQAVTSFSLVQLLSKAA